jgi:hypothetical protein
MAEPSNPDSQAVHQPGAKDEFAVSEHEFLERLNAQDSEESRERLEGMTDPYASSVPATQGEQSGGGILKQLEAFARRQPLGALLGALVAGLALGLVARRH